MKKYLLLLFLIPVYALSMENFSLPVAPANRIQMLDQLYGNICQQAHYLLGKVGEYEHNPAMKLLTKSIHGEHGIRPNTGTIMGFSFLYRFGDYNSKLVGVERSTLLTEYIIPMMNYVVATYDSIPTSDGKSWNRQWQSAHWAYSLGKAAWYIGDDLPLALKDNICRIVKSEASRFYDVVPPHRVKYDTASEENAWNSQIFHVASLLMPDDPDYSKWQHLFCKWVLSSYITSNDMKSDTVISGFKISDFEGANIYDDYTLENHNIVHPDYMCAFILSMQTAVDYKMTGREVPDFLLFNIPQIYDNLKWFSLPDGGLTYPSWQDWRIFRNPDWLINHVYMAIFAHDKDAFHYAGECLECIGLMQKRNLAGNVYDEIEYAFPSTQNDLMVYLAQTWQALHYARDIDDSYTPKVGVRHFVDGKILLNKSRMFLHSLSYGNKIMFLPTVNNGDRVFDSHAGSGIGKIRLKGEDKYLPVSLKDIKIEKAPTSYKVTMVVNHGDAVEAHYEIKALEDRLEVKEVLLAMKDCTIDYLSTSEFGILNNKCWIREKGYRPLVYNNQSCCCESLSGKVFDIAANEFRIDNISFKLNRANKSFFSKYAGAQKYNHARATDILSLNYSDNSIHISKGRTFSELRYRIHIKVD